MIPFHRIKYKSDRIRVIKCGSNTVESCYVIEVFHSNNKWIPYAIRDTLPEAIDVVISRFNADGSSWFEK